MPDNGCDVVKRLDPRATLVLDTRELGRRPGAQRVVALTEPAPAGLGIDVLGVPAGSPIELDLRFEAVMEGVLVSGTATVSLVGECTRCLGTIEGSETVDLQELYVYDTPDPDAEEETHRLDGDLLDLEPVLRDVVVLALPFNPVCGPDCRGLCPECGARLAEDPEHHHDEPIDPRWATLQRLTADADPRPGDTGRSGA